MITIAIGADHRGYEHKMVLQAGLHQETQHINWIDVGCFSPERTDYPPFARAVVDAMRAGTAHCGILLCGTGTGMAIAANRFSGIYAGVVWNDTVARRCKEEDNVNVLVIPTDCVSPAESIQLVNAWLSSTFKGGRYHERIAMIDAWKGL